jgi:hypothetical protein
MNMNVSVALNASGPWCCGGLGSHEVDTQVPVRGLETLQRKNMPGVTGPTGRIELWVNGGPTMGVRVVVAVPWNGALAVSDQPCATAVGARQAHRKAVVVMRMEDSLPHRR